MVKNQKGSRTNEVSDFMASGLRVGSLRGPEVWLVRSYPRMISPKVRLLRALENHEVFFGAAGEAKVIDNK